MASVTLSKAYLHTAVNLADYQTFWLVTLTGDDAWDAQRRTYTQGRHRLVTGDAATFDVQVAFRRLTVDERDQLRARGGTVQLLRVPHGIRRYGFFDAQSVSEHGFGPVCDVALTFQQVTRSEAV